MPKEGKGQVGGMSNPLQSAAKCSRGFEYMIGAEVRQLASFDVIPNSFGGIQVRRVSGQPFDFQPVALLEQEAFHHFAAVRRKMVPDQNDFRPPDETPQVLEEGDQAVGVEAVRFGSGQ